MPERIQLKRTKGWRMPGGAVKVDRTTDWGNPFRVGETISRDDDLWPYVAAKPGVTGDPSGWPLDAPVTQVEIISAQVAVDLFRCWFLEQPALIIRALRELPGRDLACWCKPGAACHGDWLLGLVNKVPVSTATATKRPTEG